MSKINKKSINLSLKILTILAFGLIFIPFNKVLAQNTSCGNGGCNYTYRTTSTPFNEEINNPKPVVSSISPKSSNIGVGTKTITITGNGFVPSSVARVNASNRPTTFIDDSHLLVQINGNDTSAYRTNGGFFITVFNGAPGGGYSNATFFTVNTVVAPVANTNNNNNNSPDTFTDTTQTSNTTSNTTNNTTNTTDTSTSGNNSGSSLASNAVFGSNSFLPSGLIQWVLFAIVILLIIIIARKIFGATQNYDEAPMKHA